MENEARISYLCTQAARKQLSQDEETELLGYIALDPNILQLIAIERFLRNK